MAGQLTIKQITEKTKTRKSVKIPTANIDFTDNSQIKKYKKYTHSIDLTDSNLEESLKGFKEKRCQFRAWSLDRTLDPKSSDDSCEFDQKWYPSREFSREVEYVLICMLALCNKEHV